MKRLLFTFALLAALAGCQHSGAQIWSASEANGDKPGIGFELKKEGSMIAGFAFLLDPNFPHDFSHGVKIAMTPLGQSPKEARFLVSWSEKTKETLEFRFKEQEWSDSFDATVTQISATEQFASQTYSFKATK
jgi:hypothetical protein